MLEALVAFRLVQALVPLRAGEAPPRWSELGGNRAGRSRREKAEADR